MVAWTPIVGDVCIAIAGSRWPARAVLPAFFTSRTRIRRTSGSACTVIADTPRQAIKRATARIQFRTLAGKPITDCIGRTFAVIVAEVVIALHANPIFSAGVACVTWTLRAWRLTHILFTHAVA